MTWVFQPKAVNLPSIGSRLRTSSAGPVCWKWLRSTIRVRLSSLNLAAAAAASQFCPSSELAVAGQDVGVIALLVDPGGQRVADADRQPLAERAGRGLDAGEPLHVGVPLERAAQLAQGHDLVVREIARLGQRRVEHRRRMPLGENEPVAVGPVRVLGIVPQESAEIQGRHDLDGRQRAAGMPRAGLGRHLQNVLPDRFGSSQKSIEIVGHRSFLADSPGSSSIQACVRSACVPNVKHSHANGVPNRPIHACPRVFGMVAAEIRGRCMPIILLTRVRVAGRRHCREFGCYMSSRSRRMSR